MKNCFCVEGGSILKNVHSDFKISLKRDGSLGQYIALWLLLQIMWYIPINLRYSRHDVLDHFHVKTHHHFTSDREMILQFLSIYWQRYCAFSFPLMKCRSLVSLWVKQL